jgi:hypothetical protein
VGRRRASCSCGRLVLEVTGDPLRVTVCHCLACQQRTGSAFSVNARFASEQVDVSGRFEQFVRCSDEGGDKRSFHFCPDCGSTVYYTLATLPGMVAIPVGGFADPSFPPPLVSIYESRRHAWVELAAEIERHD